MVHVETEGFRPVFDTPDEAEMAAALPVCPGYQIDARVAEPGPASHPDYGSAIEIWEGWATDPDVRFRASSGGILTALSLYLIEVERFSGVLHAGMDTDKPWMNRNYVSGTRADVLARAGSRYAPSSPCESLGEVAGDGLYAFIGKPCDVSAVAELRRRDPELDQRLGLVLSFFCAGTPSTRGTLDLMGQLGAKPQDTTEVLYRGSGWPGRFRMTMRSGKSSETLSYTESWGKLTGYRPLRCHLCPDGLGRFADISCGDAWDQFEENGDPGRSLILVRTERGRRHLRAAAAAGYITLNPADPGRVVTAQKDLLARRREILGRLAALQVAGAPVPAFHGFSLFRSWVSAGPCRWAATFGGSIRRVVQREWYRRRPRHTVAADAP
jgi:coenzyme F420 hydrogenase subunit beta